jgi:competence protein ComEA
MLLTQGAHPAPSQAQTGERPDTCLVDINEATADELEKVPGIGRARAQMIVRVRLKNGPFRQVEELRALPRLSEKTLKPLRKLLSVSRCESRPGGVMKPAKPGHASGSGAADQKDSGR